MNNNNLFLALWATPRSTSTAFEWMMRQRGDFTCFHEPFNELFYYGEDRKSDRDASVAAKPGHTYENVWRALLTENENSKLFLKDFFYSVEHFTDDKMLEHLTHTFLIRHPYKVIQGLSHHWPNCTFEEVGFDSLSRLFSKLKDRDGFPPVVIASDDLLENPKETTQTYCDAVGIEFIEDALSWEQGDRNEVNWYGEGTGPWHDALRQSTRIAPQKSNYPPLEENPALMALYQQCLPHYEALIKYKLNISQ